MSSSPFRNFCTDNNRFPPQPTTTVQSKISFSWAFHKILQKWQRKSEIQAGNCDNLKKHWSIHNGNKKLNSIFLLFRFAKFQSCWFFYCSRKSTKSFMKQFFIKKVKHFLWIINKYKVSKFIIKFVNPTLPKIAPWNDAQSHYREISINFNIESFSISWGFLFLFIRLKFMQIFIWD